MCSAALHTWIDQGTVQDGDLDRAMNMGGGTFLWISGRQAVLSICRQA